MPIFPVMHREPSPRTGGPAAPRRRLAAVVAMLSLGLLASPVAAQTGPDAIPEEQGPKTAQEQAAADAALLETLALAPEEVSPSPDDPFAQLAAARLDADRAAVVRLNAVARSSDANAKAMETAAALQRAQRREDAARNVRNTARAELEEERGRLSDLTVQAYVTGGDVAVENYRAYLEGDTTDPAAGRKIMFSQVLDGQEQITADAADALDEAVATLKRARGSRERAERRAADAMALASELTRRRAAAEGAHLAALDDMRQASEVLRSGAGRSSEVVPLDAAIIGLPRLEPEDLAGWFLAGPWRTRVTTPIEDYARWFIEEGRAEGIRGDIAFAQAVLETGGFANTDSVIANNFSGIGHYDNAPLGFIFPSPRAGVRAQIQLLKGYAVKEPAYANPLVDRRLRGPAGCCQTWGDLTTVWATDPTYGPKVMLLYTSLVDYALARRARGEGFDPALG